MMVPYAELYWEPYWDNETEEYEPGTDEAYDAIDGDLLNKIWALNAELKYFEIYMVDEMFGGRYIRVNQPLDQDFYDHDDLWYFESERRMVDEWLSSVPQDYGFPEWESEGGYIISKISSMSRRSKPKASASRKRGSKGRFVKSSSNGSRPRSGSGRRRR